MQSRKEYKISVENNHRILRTPIKIIKEIFENKEKAVKNKDPRLISLKKIKYLKMRRKCIITLNDRLSSKVMRTQEKFEIKGKIAIPLLNYIKKNKNL